MARRRRDPDFNDLPWQFELIPTAAAPLFSGFVLLVICAGLQHLANRFLEILAGTQQGAAIGHLSIGSLWPVLLTLFIVIWISSYFGFRQLLINWLNRFSS